MSKIFLTNYPKTELSIVRVPKSAFVQLIIIFQYQPSDAQEYKEISCVGGSTFCKINGPYGIIV
jgi:hypothetical protein